MASKVLIKQRKESAEQVRTLQLRLRGDFPDLDGLAKRYGQAKRLAWGRSGMTGTAVAKFKESIGTLFSLPARIFNAIDKDLGGMARSAREKAKFDIGQAADRLESLARARKKLVERHEKTPSRKLATALIRNAEGTKRWTAKLAALRVRADEAHPSLCFGSRRLFTAQHHLEENGYASHAEWLADWRAARSDQFMVVGSNDEVSGNKTCRAFIEDDGSVRLKLFLGDGHGHLELPGLTLLYGHEAWVGALLAADSEFAVSQAWQKQTKAEKARREAEFPTTMAQAERDEALEAYAKSRKVERAKAEKAGHGITYRFVRDRLGWRIMVTVTKIVPLLNPNYVRGAIGIDLNDQFVSRSRVAADGALIDSRDLPLVSNGRTAGQRRGAMHDLAHQLVSEALYLEVPLVIERLDFSAKKLRLAEVGCAAAARRLSSFAYSRFAAVLRAHARLRGVCVVEVDPAYTSVIGAALHAVPHGLTVHAAAAMTIARRAMAVEESLPERLRVWVSGRRPLSMERPHCLRRKAAVEHHWSGWAELAKAVRAARETVKAKRWTGSQRRGEIRRIASLAEARAIPF